MRINWIAQILTITMNCNSFLCSKKCLENPPVECFEPNRGLFLRLRSGYLAVFATLRNGWWDGVFECQVCGLCSSFSQQTVSIPTANLKSLSAAV